MRKSVLFFVFFNINYIGLQPKNVCDNGCFLTIKEDEKWDGLKGYITNTVLNAETVYSEYSGLWRVERAFRITKGTLELRPMFHFTPKRIKAHVCICFVAYSIFPKNNTFVAEKTVSL